MDNLTTVAEKLNSAKIPEDVFGNDANVVSAMYRDLAKIIHPDLYSNDAEKELATNLMSKLNEFRDEASKKIATKTYGIRTINFKSKSFEYNLSERIHVGGTMAVFVGAAKTVRSKEEIAIIARIPHSSKDNDLMDREMKALTTIRKYIDNTDFDKKDKKKKDKEEVVEPDPKDDKFKWAKRHIIVDDLDETRRKVALHFPNILESVKLDDTSEIRNVNIIRVPDEELKTGWLSLDQIRQRFPDGVDPRHAVWIWNRALETLIVSHAAGIIHGNITPNHVMIHPETHAGMIVDWTSSCQSGEQVPYVDEKSKDFYPEDFERYPTKSTDLYMLAKCIVYVLGGDVATLSVKKVDDPIWKVLNKSLQSKARLRFTSASTARDELRSAAEQAYGKPKFVKMEL